MLKMLKFYDLPVIDPTSNKFSYYLVDFFCKHISFLCKFAFKLISDKRPYILDIKNTASYLQHYPANTSIKSLEHFWQFIKLREPIFKKFDYGEEGNLQKYNQKFPPEYDLKKVTII